MKMDGNCINREVLLENIQKAAMKSGRTGEQVTVIAVSKKQDIAQIKKTWNMGYRAFGENYVKELVGKQDELKSLRASWHFIGGLQNNKIKFLINRCSIIHSVAKESSVIEFSKRIVESESQEQNILLQLNIEEEESKLGLSISEAPHLIEKIQKLPGLRIRGLMVMPPVFLNPSDRHRVFSKTKNLSFLWKKYLSDNHSMDELSMGTSGDYIEAIEEGATLVRLGTLIMGERQ